MDQDIERTYEALGSSMMTREQAELYLDLDLPVVRDMAQTIIELYDELDRVNDRVDSLETMVTVWSSAFRTQWDSMR